MPKHRTGLALAVFLSTIPLALSACPQSSPSSDEDEDQALLDAPVLFPITVGENAGRPAEVRGPEGWRGEDRLPVIFILHGYSANALIQETIVFRFTSHIETDRFLLVLPEGTVNEEGDQFWAATQTCCDFYNSGVDDVSYLLGLVDELAERVPIDEDRVYFTGHSNGGFMSYTMACEAPSRVAGIMNFAGSTFVDPAKCTVGAPVHVLDIHGTLDETILYNGNPNPPGPNNGGYPSAIERAERWATRAGCDVDSPAVGSPLDLVGNPEGQETDVLQWSEGCTSEKDVSLWTMNGVGHIPAMGDGFHNNVVPWLLSRTR